MNRFYSLGWRVAMPALLLLAACEGNNVTPSPAKVDGWKPIYSTNAEAVAIKGTDPRLIENGGKIYTKGNILYQVETGKGIHIIDISQPANPQKLKFITVRGVQEMAIKDNYLYANNLNDLVVVDISDLSAVKEVNRMVKIFHLVDQELPPSSGYFECVDASKGTVVGWEQTSLDHPKCMKN